MRLFGLPQVPQPSEGGDERWLITYADMITLLLVLFIILYATANTDLQKFQALAEAIAKGFGATEESLSNRQGEGGASIVFDTSGGGTKPVELFPEDQIPISIFDFAQMLGSVGGDEAGGAAGDAAGAGQAAQGNLGRALADLVGEAIAEARAGGELPEGIAPGGITPEMGPQAGDQGRGPQTPGQGQNQGETGAGELTPGQGASPGDQGLGELTPGQGASPGDQGQGQLQPGQGMNRGETGAGELSNVGRGQDIRDLGAGIEISYNERGIVISIFPDQILFDSGSAHLKPAFKKILDALSDPLNRLPNLIEVDGHTDSVPINTFTYPSNWELSAGRAGSVGRYLISQGLSPERLRVAGYADTRPVDSNETVNGRSRNRRVEIIVLRRGDEPVGTATPESLSGLGGPAH